MEEKEFNPENQPVSEDTVNTGKKKGLWWKILLAVLAGILLLAAIAGVVIWQVNDFYVQVALHGEPEITVEFGQQFEDPGAEGFFAGTRIFTNPKSLQVEISGEVDDTVLGDYELTYTSSYEINLLVVRFPYSDSKKLVVHVVDTQAPAITLTTDPEKYTIPGESYEEEGFSAVDNYDGDLTAAVQRQEENGKIIYTVTDASGNSTTVERIINYHDPIAPELVLSGNAELNIVVGGTYSEPGFTATDNCDGDLTDKVVISGSVDTSKAGTYTLEYSVTDSYNNTVTASRVVNVYKRQTAPQYTMPNLPMGDGAVTVEPNGKVIYLTFDDGPSSHTARLLDVLDKYGVKATFFVVKTGYLHLLPRMVQSGHTVAIHSLTHDYEEIYSSELAYFNDLYQMQSIVQSYTGVTPTLIRFPGGSSNTVSRNYCKGIMTTLTQKLEEMGYKYFDWNVDSCDASTSKTTADVVNRVIGGCKNRKYSIVLQHDTKGFSVNAVEQIIQWGLANGYTFKALSSSSPGCHHGLNN